MFPPLTRCSPRSHPAACKNHPGTRARLQPCPCFSSMGTVCPGAWAVGWPRVFPSNSEKYPGKWEGCVYQIPRGHSRCNPLEHPDVQSCLCHPSKGDFCHQLHRGKRKEQNLKVMDWCHLLLMQQFLWGLITRTISALLGNLGSAALFTLQKCLNEETPAHFQVMLSLKDQDAGK